MQARIDRAAEPQHTHAARFGTGRLVLALATVAVLILAGKRIINKRNQVLPLHLGSILKFINEKMTIALSQPFVYKRCWLILNFPMNNSIEFGYRKNVLLLLNFIQFITYSI